jgi:hypothetical protein
MIKCQGDISTGRINVISNLIVLLNPIKDNLKIGGQSQSTSRGFIIMSNYTSP